MTEQHQNAIINFVRRLTLKSSNDQDETNSGIETDILPHTTTTTMISSVNDNTNAQLEEIYQTIDILAGGIQALNEDAQRLSNDSLYLQNGLDVLTKNFATLKLSVEEQNAFLDALKPNQEILNQDVASLKQKVEEMQSVSYDGILIWKITGFKEKIGRVSIAFQFHLYKT
jgi:chromosome segregation ATPase